VRFLHTGDWHLGKTLRLRSRAAEHERALDEILAIAKDAKVDAVLIGGDTFDDGADPPPEAELMLNAFLDECCGVGIRVVLIGGNHDHPKRLAAQVRLLDRLRIYIRPEVQRPQDGGVIALPSRDGRELAKVAVLPFVSERRIVTACELMNPAEEWYQTYAGRIQQLLSALTADFDASATNIVLAHLLVHGALVGTGERKLHLGQIYGITPQALPSNAHYIGLNHLHRPQNIPAPSWTEYSGSILSLDFGEVDQAKRVVLIEAHPGRSVDAGCVQSVPLTSGRPLRDVRGSLDQLRTQAPELAGAYLRVTLEVDKPEPGLAQRVKEILPDALEVSLFYPRQELAVTVEPASREPLDLLRAYYAREHGAALPEEMGDLFRRLYEEELHAAS
jgi:DNA repair protein SbcD/Mre11